MNRLGGYMSVNLDSDLAVWNATAKTPHPKGQQLTWVHEGRELSVVYEAVNINTVSDWASRVRAFVKQVKEEAELRARRDKALREAEQQAEPADRPMFQNPPDKNCVTMPDGECVSPVPCMHGEPGPNPLEYMQQSLREAERNLRQLQEQGAALTRQIAAAERNVSMLQAALQAMEAVQENRHETDQGERGKTARQPETDARAEREAQESVQSPAQSAPRRQAGKGKARAGSAGPANPAGRARDGGGAK